MLRLEVTLFSRARRLAVTLLPIFCSAFFVSNARAAVVYENPWNNLATDAGSFSQPNGERAAEFILATDTTVKRATWYGTMFSSDPLNTGDTWNFIVNFYSDAVAFLAAC